jgi:hypothetical protein
MKMITIIVDDATLLPFFVDHYKALGITEFHAVVFKGANPDPTEFAALARQLERCPVNIHSILEEDGHPGSFRPRFEEMRRRVVGEGEWYMTADLDEFYEFSAPIPDLIYRAESHSLNCVRGHFLDRVTEDGTLAEVDGSAGKLSSQFPLGGQLTRHLVRGATRKIMLINGPKVAVKYSHHDCNPERPVCTHGIVHHYKWNQSLINRMNRRAVIYRKYRHAQVQETDRILAHLKRNNGRIDVTNPIFKFARVGH